MYKHFDGIIWPEILDHAALGVFTKVKKRWGIGIFKSNKPDTATCSDDVVDVKSLDQSQHKRLRSEALNCYFNRLYHVICGPEPIKDPVEVTEEAHAIYASLNSSFVYFDKHETHWKFDELEEVSYVYYSGDIYILHTLSVHMYVQWQFYGLTSCIYIYYIIVRHQGQGN